VKHDGISATFQPTDKSQTAAAVNFTKTNPLFSLGHFGEAVESVVQVTSFYIKNYSMLHRSTPNHDL